MPKYQVDFSYKIPEWGTIDNLIAASADEAEDTAMKYIENNYEGIIDVMIDLVRELEND